MINIATVRALTDYLLDQINTGSLWMSDPVPVEVEQFIDNGHKTVSEYVAEKYEIKGVGVSGAASVGRKPDKERVSERVPECEEKRTTIA